MDHHPDEKEGNMDEIVTNNTATDNKISEPPPKNKKD